MKRLGNRCAIMLALFCGGPGSSVAAEPADIGKNEYESNCILCHGKDLKGGPYASLLNVTPPDLSRLSKNNGGVFPFESVYSVIEGRKEVKAHGSSEMLIWGKDYQLKAAEHYFEMQHNANSSVRGRLLALIDYLNRMQQK